MKRQYLMARLLVLATLIPGYPVLGAADDGIKQGVWLWGSTVREMGPAGATIITAQLAAYGFQDIFLLVKGSAGTVEYASKIALSTSIAQNAGTDVLQTMIAEGHRRGLRIHAWYVINSDRAFLNVHPAEGMVHYRNGPDKERISPASAPYRTYMKSLLTEVVANYDIDGIHLDYIRYPHALYGFSEAELAAAGQRGVDIDRIKALMNQTFYDPKDNTGIFRAFAAGDLDVVKWAENRSAIIADLAQELKETIATTGTGIPYSAALMPEGANNPAYAALHYGQLYAPAAQLYDFVAPMMYWVSYSSQPSWVGTITKATAGIVEAEKTYAGLQAFGISGSRSLEEAQRFAIQNGAAGIVLFRYGTCAFAKLQHRRTGDAVELAITVLNATFSLADRIEIDFTGTELVPAEVVGLPDALAFTVVGNKVEITAGNLLSPGATGQYLIRGQKSPERIQYANPDIGLSFQRRVQIPVYVAENIE